MRRTEDEYTAHELEDRWGREQVAVHPVFGVVPDLACKACCNTPTDQCICAEPGEVEFNMARRRARRLSIDYRPTPGGGAAA